MPRRKENPAIGRKSPPKEQVVQIIVSDSLQAIEDGAEKEINTSAAGQNEGITVSISAPSTSKAGQSPQPKRRAAASTNFHYQTRQRSGVIKKTTPVDLPNENDSPQQHVQTKRRRTRQRKVSASEANEDLVLLEVNNVNCSEALDPSLFVGGRATHEKKSDDELLAKFRLIVADANDPSENRETTLKARVLLEQIQNYKAKAFKFSVDTAIEYTKWNELSSKSYEFVRTLYGEGLFTLPSVKTIRRYMDPFSESVLLTNLEAAQNTLQQLQDLQGDESGSVFLVDEVNEYPA